MAHALGRDTGTVTLQYNPYQDAFFKALTARDATGKRIYDRFALIAGRRGGKTAAGAIAAAMEASVPHTLGWACAPTYDDLHDFVMPAVFEAIPHKFFLPGKDGWSAEHRTATLVNQAKIVFRSLDDPERVRGPGLHWLWIDEGRKLPRTAWDTAEPALVDNEGVAWITTTPNGEDWVYEEFWERAKAEEEGYWACQYPTTANPKIDPAYVERMRRRMDPRTFEREFLASFITFAGSIYGESLTDDLILKTDDEVRRVLPEWPRVDPSRESIVGLDSGADHPFGAVQIVITEHGLVAVSEYLRRDNVFAMHAKAIHQTVLPCQIRWAANKTERQPRLELVQHGIVCQGVDNSVDAGIQRVQSWLVAKQLFFVQSRVPQLLKQMKSYRYADTNVSAKTGETKDKERVFKKHDDLCDCLRYACVAWPRLPEIAVELPDGTGPRNLLRHPLPPGSEDLYHKWQDYLRDEESRQEPENALEDFYA